MRAAAGGRDTSGSYPGHGGILGRLGAINLAPTLGMVEFSGRLGAINLAPTLGMVEFSGRLGAINLAPTARVLRMFQAMYQANH